MERTIRVKLPIGSPDGTLKLSNEIEDKHTALGAASPLTGFVDMVAFDALRLSAKALQDSGDVAEENSVGAHGEAAMICGISEGQNKQTRESIYWYVLQVRDILLFKNRGMEQNLEQWGFTVVISQTGAKRNVRVDVPNRNPDTLVELAEAIVAKDTALGAGSPLTGNVDMADFGTKVTAARTLIDTANTERANKEAFHGDALTEMGYSEGQSAETPGTLYYYLTAIRDRLLQVNQDKEQYLEQWGFDVVISAHATGKKTGTKTVVREGDVSSGETGSLDGALIQTTDATMVTIEVSPNPLRLSSNNTEAAPSGPVFWDAPAGTTVKTISEFLALIGASEINHYIKIQNLNAVLGHFKITFSNLA